MDVRAVGQRFGYDLLGMGGLPQHVADYAGTSPTTSYFYGVGSDRPLDLIVNGASYYCHRDASGSTTVLTGPSGSIAASYTYDAYGNLVLVADNVGNPLRCEGEEPSGRTERKWRNLCVPVFSTRRAHGARPRTISRS